MFCPECGETIDDGAQFCPNCGARFSEEDITEVAKDKPGKKSPLVPILAIVAVVLGLGVGIGLYATQNKKADKKAEEQAKKEEKKKAEKKQKEEKEDKKEEKKEELDPFADLAVAFEGENGKGTLVLRTPTNDGPVTDYFFEWENNGKLSNGDVVVMIYNQEKQEKYYPEYKVAKTTNKYAVTGLKELQKEQPAPNYNAGVPSDLATSDSLHGFILFYSDSKYYDRAYLETLSARQLRFARNEIFARYGREFNDAQLQDYFYTREWYYPAYTAAEFDAISGQFLNQYEKANVQLMNTIEKEKGN